MALEWENPEIKNYTAAQLFYTQVMRYRSSDPLRAAIDAKRDAAGLVEMKRCNYDFRGMRASGLGTMRTLAEMCLFSLFRAGIPQLDDQPVIWNFAFRDPLKTSLIAKPNSVRPVLGVSVTLGNSGGVRFYPELHDNFGVYQAYPTRQDISVMVDMDTAPWRKMVHYLMQQVDRELPPDIDPRSIKYDLSEFRALCRENVVAVVGGILGNLGSLPEEFIDVPLSRPMKSFLDQLQELPDALTASRLRRGRFIQAGTAA
jgi:hypothetical protein